MYTHTQIIACVFIIDNCKDYKYSKEKQNEYRFRYHLIDIKLFPPPKSVRDLRGLVLLP